MVSFTGSTRAGRRVAAVGAETVKKVALELGGKSASVVLDDADLVAGRQDHRGELLHEQRPGVQRARPACWSRPTGTTRRSRRPPRRRRSTCPATRAESTRIGPAVSAAQRDRVRRLHPQGRRGGRDAGGGRSGRRCEGAGYFVRPTVFGNVKPDMTIAQEEIFGPVLVVLPVRRRGRGRPDRQRHPVRPGGRRVRRRRRPRSRRGGQAAGRPGGHQRRRVQHQGARSAGSSSPATAASSAASAWRSSPN